MVRESNGWDHVFWEQEYGWPRGDRKHIFLAAAVEEIGRAMFGPDWTGDEPVEGVNFDQIEAHSILADPRQALLLREKKPLQTVSRRVPGRFPPEATQAKRTGCYDAHVIARSAHRFKQRCDELVDETNKAFESFGRLDSVCEWIADHGRNGDLPAVGRDIEGGPFFPLGTFIWNTEKIWERRVRDSRVNVRRHANAGDVYIFLDRDSLAACIRSLPYAPQPVAARPPQLPDDVWLSPFIEVMIETAREVSLGPTPDQHADVEAIQAAMALIAEKRRLEMSPNLLRTAATLIRHPDAREGIKVWKAKLRAAQGSTL